MDLRAAREAADRLEQTSGGDWLEWHKLDFDLVDYTSSVKQQVVEDVKALVAAVKDPALLLPAAKWERLKEDRCWRWQVGPWTYYARPNLWLVGGPDCDGFTHDCDSLSTAQAACEEDMRERVRKLFKEQP